MELKAGARLGPYTLVEPLGSGGMASVFKAYEPGLDRHVALKILMGRRDARFIERFEREARVIAKLEHPGIVPIFSFGIASEERLPRMAMRLVAGGTLDTLIEAGRLDAGDTVTLIRQVADALDYAHAHGVVHRDVKPQNVLLDERGRVYLADFGIARDTEGQSQLTKTGMINGTPEYMSPEQATGIRVDGRADVYSLGVVAYKCLVGRTPFDGTNPVAVLMQHVSQPPPEPPPELVPASLVAPVMKALEKEPADRWSSAGELASALERGLKEITSPEPTAARVMSHSAPSMAPTAPVRRKPILTGAVLWMVSGALLAWLLGVAAVVAAVILVGPSYWRQQAPTVAPVVQPQPTATPTPEPVREPELVEVAVATPTPRPTPQPTPEPTPDPTPEATPTAAPTPPPIPVELTVDAAQDGLAESAVDRLFVRVLVDGERLEDFVLTFEGATPFERSQTRQTFQLRAVPSGSRTIAILTSSEASMRSGIDRVERTLIVGPKLSLVIREKLDGGRELRIR